MYFCRVGAPPNNVHVTSTTTIAREPFITQPIISDSSLRRNNDSPLYCIILTPSHTCNGPSTCLYPLIRLALPFFASRIPGVVVEWIQNDRIPGATRWSRPVTGRRGDGNRFALSATWSPSFIVIRPWHQKRCCPLTSKGPTRFSIGGNRRSNCDDPLGGPDDRPPPEENLLVPGQTVSFVPIRSTLEPPPQN